MADEPRRSSREKQCPLKLIQPDDDDEAPPPKKQTAKKPAKRKAAPLKKAKKKAKKPAPLVVPVAPGQSVGRLTLVPGDNGRFAHVVAIRALLDAYDDDPAAAAVKFAADGAALRDDLWSPEGGGDMLVMGLKNWERIATLGPWILNAFLSLVLELLVRGDAGDDAGDDAGGDASDDDAGGDDAGGDAGGDASDDEAGDDDDEIDLAAVAEAAKTAATTRRCGIVVRRLAALGWIAQDDSGAWGWGPRLAGFAAVHTGQNCCLASIVLPRVQTPARRARDARLPTQVSLSFDFAMLKAKPSCCCCKPSCWQGAKRLKRLLQFYALIVAKFRDLGFASYDEVLAALRVTPATASNIDIRELNRVFYLKLKGQVAAVEAGDLAHIEIQVVDACLGTFGTARHQIFNPTSMCAYSTVSMRFLVRSVESSMRENDPSKNQPKRRRFDGARELRSLATTSQLTVDSHRFREKRWRVTHEHLLAWKAASPEAKVELTRGDAPFGFVVSASNSVTNLDFASLRTKKSDAVQCGPALAPTIKSIDNLFFSGVSVTKGSLALTGVIAGGCEVRSTTSNGDLAQKGVAVGDFDIASANAWFAVEAMARGVSPGLSPTQLAAAEANSGGDAPGDFALEAVASSPTAARPFRATSPQKTAGDALARGVAALPLQEARRLPPPTASVLGRRSPRRRRRRRPATRPRFSRGDVATSP